MNNKKFCFISCVNDEEVYSESVKYINSLIKPDDYEVEIVSISGAESMASGYNDVMRKSDAKYKIYIHQDVFIINKNFLYDILDVFDLDNGIGLIGVVGTDGIPADGVWWNSKHKYGKIYGYNDNIMKASEFCDVKSDYKEVKAVDGLILITQYDIPWRSDIFTGWHFYDISQCAEFSLKGYKIVIPKQNEPWVMHDSEMSNLNNYHKYRKIFLKEYGKKI